LARSYRPKDPFGPTEGGGPSEPFEKAGVGLSAMARLPFGRSTVTTTEAKLIAGISRSLTSDVTDEEAVLVDVAGQIAGALGDLCVVALFSDQGSVMPRALGGRDPQEKLRLCNALPAVVAELHELIDEALATNTPVQVGTGTSAAPGRRPSRPHGALSAIQARTALIVPIRDNRCTASLPRHGNVVGVIITMRTDADRYYDDEVELLQGLADFVGLWLSGAHLHACLTRSEDRYESALHAMLVGFYILAAVRGSDGRIVDFRYEFANEAACRYNDLTQEQLIGRLLSEQVPAVASGGALTEWAEVVETGVPLAKNDWALEGTWGSKSKELRYFDNRATKMGKDMLALAFQDVTARVEAVAALEQRSRRLETALGRLIDAHEDERRSVADDLHAGAVQRLAAASWRLDSLVKPPQTDGNTTALTDMNDSTGTASEQAQLTAEMLRDTIDELRDLASSLAEPVLLARGLEAAVTRTVKRRAATNGLVATIDIVGVPRLGRHVEELAFQAIQESVSNVVKHAKATRLTVRLRYARGALTGFVRDNGKGPDMAAVARNARGDRPGVKWLEETLALVGGEYVLHPGRGGGAEALFVIPV
jgi:signal transduction histidine kinase